ncbi:MAG: nuclear transport factor 2 family protein [Flavobacteriaceae bacterium]|nr:nuclear transport factor 2 family protein [Flavobacteriaceae bacterium]
MKKLIFIFFEILALSISSISAQVSEDNILFLQLKKMDSIVFEEGFNKCNLKDLEKTLHSEFEFYHDVGGFQEKEAFMVSMKNNICSNNSQKPIRKLVEDSLQVSPLYNQGILYGAIQNGTHEFWIKEPNKELYQTGIAKFSTTWLLIEGEWKMKNVLSFDHHEAK